jgi:excisionase family DNA binding protein
MSELLTTKELMARLKVSRFTLYNWRDNGLPFIKVGPGTKGSVRYDWDKVQEWIQGSAK